MRKDYGKIVLYLLISIIVIGFMKCVLPYFWPFVVAVIIVVPLQQLCIRKGYIRQKGKGLMAGGILFVILLVMALIFVGIGTFMVSKVQSFMQNMTVLENEVKIFFDSLCRQIEQFTGLSANIIEEWCVKGIKGISEKLFLSGGGTWICGTWKYMVGIGKIFSFILVSFICVVLFAREVEDWRQGLIELAAMAPAIDRILAIIIRIGKRLGSLMKTYLKTQGTILVCICITAVTGLFIAGVEEALFYGILAGIMDFLPFIGTGIVLVPIGVVSLIGGHILRGGIVLITYVLCAVIREIIEPRLMGNGIRISPVCILLSVYAGVLFYGVGGVILGPVTLLILVETAREIF